MKPYPLVEELLAPGLLVAMFRAVSNAAHILRQIRKEIEDA